jgi:hypothetical protein
MMLVQRQRAIGSNLLRQVTSSVLRTSWIFLTISQRGNRKPWGAIGLKI